MGMIGSTKASRLKELLSGMGGQEIAEAAIVLPLLFMLLFGIYWFGRAFNIYGTINHAAREGARVGMTSTCASCGNTAAIPPGPGLTPTVTIVGFLQVFVNSTNPPAGCDLDVTILNVVGFGSNPPSAVPAISGGGIFPDPCTPHHSGR
jgi:hypothetical protein